MLKYWDGNGRPNRLLTGFFGDGRPMVIHMNPPDSMLEEEAKRLGIKYVKEPEGIIKVVEVQYDPVAEIDGYFKEWQSDNKQKM